MSVSISHEQSRTVQPGPAYQVTDTVTATVSINPAVFVLSTLDDSFLNVAAVDEMLRLPVNKADAVAAGLTAYRVAAVTVIYPTLKAATDFAATVTQRLQQLANDYNVAVTSFVGTIDETLTSIP